MKRSNLEKTVAQLYLKDLELKNEILRKAQMYEHSIMHRTNDCKSNIEVNGNIKFFAPTPLHHEVIGGKELQHVNAILKPHACNRSGVYISSKGTICDITIPSSAAAEDPLVSLKAKHKVNRNKKILKLRKYKDMFNMREDRLQSLISIDKL